jgi:hypothetical protein
MRDRVSDVADQRGRTGGDDDLSVRYGPGVRPTDTTPLAEAWRAGRLPRQGRRRPRNLISSLVTIVIVGGVVLWLILRAQGPGLEVTAIRVQAPQATQRCDANVEIVGVLTTNGERGQIAYRWQRSDGDETGILRASVEKGRREVPVPFHWTIKGEGELHAVATLELLAPGDATRRASASFDYQCR